MQFCFQGVYGKCMRYQIFEGGGGGGVEKNIYISFDFFFRNFRV